MEPPDSSVITTAIGLVISLFSVSIFAFLETTITALRPFRLKEIANSTNKYKSLFKILEYHPNRILITILVVNNLVNVITAIFSNQLMDQAVLYFHLPERISFIIGIIITTFSILIFELIPKNIAKAHGDEFFSSTLWIINIIYYIFYPPVKIIANFAQIIVEWTNPNKKETSEEIAKAIDTEKEIKFLIDYIKDKGLMESHKTDMLQSIFELGKTTIKEIMVPENGIAAININSNKKEILEMFSKYQFTRLPVYEDNKNNIIGILYQKDFFQILSKDEDKPIKDIMRPFIYFPETAKLLGVLKELREQRIHMALVLNEFGSIIGLVTLEDILEEIVGEISDEYESINEKAIPLQPAGWLVEASIELEELSKLLNISFNTNAITLAGFLIEQFQKVPKKGDFFYYDHYKFTVREADNKRITQVVIDLEEQISE